MTGRPAHTPRPVAVVCDLVEEGWTSMDLAGDMLLAHLASDHSAKWAATRVRPAMRRRLTRSTDGHPSGDRAAQRRFNADRLLNRFWDYPRHLRGVRSGFELFHLVDHSYGQLVHQIPAARTVVTCHDTDMFRCLLADGGDPRPWAFRRMSARILAGVAAAARVICVSDATRADLLRYPGIEPERLVVIPNGVHPACTAEPDPVADRAVERWLGRVDPARPELLHVGTTIPRKRLDVLLRVFAGVREAHPGARLVRAGGALTGEQRRLAEELGLGGALVELPFLGREELASVYRRATLVLQPSDSEGFGLPVAEAMACATPVVASDLGALRETGGAAAVFLPAGRVEAWVPEVVALLRQARAGTPEWEARRQASVARASRFSWAENARRTSELYDATLVEAAASGARYR